jgi:hypothetical protein
LHGLYSVVKMNKKNIPIIIFSLEQKQISDFGNKYEDCVT